MKLDPLKVVPMADYGKGVNTSGMSFAMPKNKKNKEDEEDKKESGGFLNSLNNLFEPQDTTKQVVKNQVPQDSSSFKDYAVADVIDPATYTGDFNAPGGILDTILSFTVPGYSILRNLKAMEDPDKYGKGTMVGMMRGYGDKKGLLDGNPFSGWFGGSSTPNAPSYGNAQRAYGGYNYAPTGYGTYGTQAYNNLGFGQANSFADDTAYTNDGNMDWGSMTEAEASSWDEIG